MVSVLSNLTSDWTTSPMIVRADPVDALSPQTPQAEKPLVPVMQTYCFGEKTTMADVVCVIFPGWTDNVVSQTPKKPPCAASRKRIRQDWGHSSDSAPVTKKSCEPATDTWEGTVTVEIENIVVSIPCSSVDEEKQIRSLFAMDLGDNDEVQTLLDAAPDFPIGGVKLGEDLVDPLNYIANESSMV